MELEAHHLREWSSPKEPAFFLQQLRNRCFECGLWELQVRAEQALSAKGWPYLRERVRTDREVSGRIRTFEAAPDPPGKWRNKAVGGVALTPDSAPRRRLVRRQDHPALGARYRPYLAHPPGAHGRGEGGRRDRRRAQAISASIDRTLKVWDLETGRALRTLTGHKAGVWGVAVTPDGRSAVFMDHTLKVWDLVTGGAAHPRRTPGLRARRGGDPTGKGGVGVDGWHPESVAPRDRRHGAHAPGPQGRRLVRLDQRVRQMAVSGSSDRAVLVWDLSRAGRSSTPSPATPPMSPP